MQEIIRDNDPVRLSFFEAVLRASGIPALILDRHMAAVEGSIGAIPRRLMVGDGDAAAARRIVREADPAGGSPAGASDGAGPGGGAGRGGGPADGG